MANKKKNTSRLTSAQRAEKMRAAEERQRQAQVKRDHKERTKKILFILLTVVLVIGLTLPIASLSLLGGK